MVELLEYQHFIDINEELYKMSLEDREIEYSGKEDYPIIKRKIRALVYNVPKGSLLKIATYYLCNLILLQPFADGNHRTALHAVKLFAFKNGQEFSYTDEEAHEFQISLYKVRDNYEAQDIEIFQRPDSEVLAVCEKFLEEHLTEDN